MNISMIMVAAAVVAAIAGCNLQRPVLYRSAKYKQVGEATARQDVDGPRQAGVLHSGSELVVRRGARRSPASPVPWPGAYR
jgi:hypothetical protein